MASGTEHPALESPGWAGAVELSQQRAQNSKQQPGIVERSMAIPRLDPEEVSGQVIETAALGRRAAIDIVGNAPARPREHQMGKLQGVEPDAVGNRHSRPGSCRFQQREVVAQAVVGDHRPVADEPVEVSQCLG